MEGQHVTPRRGRHSNSDDMSQITSDASSIHIPEREIVEDDEISQDLVQDQQGRESIQQPDTDQQENQGPGTSQTQTFPAAVT